MGGRDGSDEIIQNPVGDRFGKRTRVAEGVEVQFEGLALDAFLLRGVANGDGRKVGLTGDRAERGEFRSGEGDLVGAAGFGVWKSFQSRQRRVGWDGNFSTEKAKSNHE